MNKKYLVSLYIFLCLAIVVFLVVFSVKGDLAVINPKGLIGMQQRDLLVFATILMLLIVVPVCIIAVVIAWNFRKENTKAKYDPNWNDNFVAECFWWGVPCLIVFVLAIITWKGCYDLDPYKPIASHKKPLTIQVVALDWKWLFIYPEQNIATINYCQFPNETPIKFEITADAPMNSFWIPELGGQIFAMAAMKTELNLIANKMGSYRGVSANISGRGFAGMTFVAKSSSDDEFNKWVQSTKQSRNVLDLNEYKRLLIQSEYEPVALYSLKQNNLFDWVLMKYMSPTTEHANMGM